MSENSDLNAEEIQSSLESESGAAAQDSSDRAKDPEYKRSPEGAEIHEPENRIKVLEEENSSLKDQYLRKQAEFENYRKRMQKEKQENIQFANKQLLLDIIPTLDDFERAIKSGEESQDFTAFHDGILLIEKQFSSLLERKWGLKRFDSRGNPFDPQLHEAIIAEPCQDHDTSMVLDDYQKGYLLHDKVLRAAKVKVSLPGSGDNEHSQSNE
jgi:molecular chaperone GrpE